VESERIIEKVKEWLIKERFSDSLNVNLVRTNNQLLLEYIEKLQGETNGK
jgi:hypothetical protein